MIVPANNTKRKLVDIVTRIENDGLEVVVFGGWSSELLGVEKPWPHSDIDLLLLDKNFDRLIEVVKNNGWNFVKFYSHKKAFIVDDIMVEVFLVKLNDGEFTTEFIGEKRPVLFQWPSELFVEKTIDGKGLKLASNETVAKYRKNHAQIHSHSPWK